MFIHFFLSFQQWNYTDERTYQLMMRWSVSCSCTISNRLTICHWWSLATWKLCCHEPLSASWMRNEVHYKSPLKRIARWWSFTSMSFVRSTYIVLGSSLWPTPLGGTEIASVELKFSKAPVQCPRRQQPTTRNDASSMNDGDDLCSFPKSDWALSYS